MENREALQKAAEFHGHICPGLVTGVKVAEAVNRELGLDGSADEELVCVTENDACGVDAIQVLLHCTFGKGNLLLRDRGKHVYTFFDRHSGRTLRLSMKAARPDTMSREDWIETLLAMAVDDVFDRGEARFELPEKASIFQSRPCALCGEKTGEHRLRVQDGQLVCLDCFRDYDRAL